MFLLFKNSFNNLKKVWLQFVCMVLLLVCGMGLFFGNNGFSANLQQRLDERLTSGKMHQFTNFYTDFSNYKVDGKSVDTSSDDYLKTFDAIYQSGTNEFNYDFARMEFFAIQQNSKNRNVNFEITTLSTKSDPNNPNLKVESDIDRTFPERWVNPGFTGGKQLNKNEILVSQVWAQALNYKIGDKLNLSNQEYTIVGYDIASNYILNVVANSFIPNIYTQAVITMNQSDYTEYHQKFAGSSKITHYYAFRFNDLSSKRSIQKREALMEKWFANNPNPAYQLTTNSDKQKLLFDDIWTAKNIINTRINYLISAISNNKLISDTFLAIILGISFVILFIVIKKMIEDSQQQIGCLKSLGYNNAKIAFSFTSFAFQAVSLSTVISFFIGFFLIPSFYSGSVKVSYVFDIPTYYFSVSAFMISIFVPLVSLIAFSWLLSYWYVRRPSMSLINGAGTYKNNFLIKQFGTLVDKLAFKIKFPLMFAFKSIGKISIMSLTTLFSTFFIFFVLSGSGIANFIVNQTKDAVTYQYKYNFNTNTALNNSEFSTVADQNFNPDMPLINDTRGYDPATASIYEKGSDYTNNPITYHGYLTQTDGKMTIQDIPIMEVGLKNIQSIINKFDADFLKYQWTDFLKGLYFTHNSDPALTYLIITALPSDPTFGSLSPDEQTEVLSKLTALQNYIKSYIGTTNLILPIGFTTYASSTTSGMQSKFAELPFLQESTSAQINSSTGDKSQNTNTVTLSGYNFTGDMPFAKDANLNLSEFFSSSLINSFINFKKDPINKVVPVEASEIFLKSRKMKVGDTFNLDTKSNGWKAKIISSNTDFFNVGLTTDYFFLNEYLNDLLINNHSEWDKYFDMVPDETYKFQQNSVLSGINQQYIINSVMPMTALKVGESPTSQFGPISPALSSLPFSTQQILDSLGSLLGLFNDYINVLVAFAALIALLIVLLIMNIIIQENRYAIGTMKVLGYRNKEINKLFTQIYLPFVILAVGVGIIVAYYVLNWVSDFLSEKTGSPLYFNYGAMTFALTPLIMVLIFAISFIATYFTILRYKVLELTASK